MDDGQAAAVGAVGESAGPGEHYVYLYRDDRRRPRYVGYGRSPERATQHARESHNAALGAWLQEGSYQLEVAGPYDGRDAGLAVEAALISALAPEYNVSPGTGPKFAPLGVPPHLADRVTAEPLTEAEVGRIAGGALLVCITPGEKTADGRVKVDPVRPDVLAIARNVREYWQLDRYVGSWAAAPGDGPQVLVGVHGPPKHRYVLGSFRIDTTRWGVEEPGAREGNLWRVPLVDRADPDALGLRGRRLADVRFAQGKSRNFHVVDASGRVTHPLT